MDEARTGLIIDLQTRVLDVGGADIEQDRAAVAAVVFLVRFFAHSCGFASLLRKSGCKREVKLVR